MAECFEFAYTGHIGKDCDIYHSLKKQLMLSGSSAVVGLETTGFDTCLVPYKVLQDIWESLCAEVAHSGVIEFAAIRLRLYSSHMHLVIAWERRMAEYFHTMKGRQDRASEILIMDYKMKLEPIRYWKSSVELYGKRGISLHSAGVLYRREPEKGAVGDELESFAIYHIYRNDNFPDYWALSCTFDAIVAHISLELPNVTSLTVFTDSARNYQNYVIPVVPPFICQAHVVTIDALICPKLVRGKGIDDSHLAVAMHHVHRYVQVTGRNS